MQKFFILIVVNFAYSNIVDDLLVQGWGPGEDGRTLAVHQGRYRLTVEDASVRGVVGVIYDIVGLPSKI